MDYLTDGEIAALIAEQKPLPPNYMSRMQLKPKRGHREREIDVTGGAGSEFRLILRENTLNVLDFSVILAYRPPRTNRLFRLRRYNGKSHEHTNMLEAVTFYDFHIHMATERYQQAGPREDAYAERTARYADFDEALRCMLDDCGFDTPDKPPGAQMKLFGEV